MPTIDDFKVGDVWTFHDTDEEEANFGVAVIEKLEGDTITSTGYYINFGVSRKRVPIFSGSSANLDVWSDLIYRIPKKVKNYSGCVRKLII